MQHPSVSDHPKRLRRSKLTHSQLLWSEIDRDLTFLQAAGNREDNVGSIALIFSYCSLKRHQNKFTTTRPENVQLLRKYSSLWGRLQSKRQLSGKKLLLVELFVYASPMKGPGNSQVTIAIQFLLRAPNHINNLFFKHVISPFLRLSFNSFSCAASYALESFLELHATIFSSMTLKKTCLSHWASLWLNPLVFPLQDIRNLRVYNCNC